MKLYHATTVPGLDVLKANSHDRDGKPVLYLTDNFSYSLFYIRDREIDFVTCGVREGGIVHYDEKFPHQLETLYEGLSGYVYEVEAEAEATKIKGIYVARGDLTVAGSIQIPDALRAIREEIGKGNVCFLRYESLTEEQKKLNFDGLVQWFASETTMNPRKINFLREHFPEAWEEARRVLDKSQ